MLWGYAGPWYGKILEQDEDPLFSRLNFLRKHELKVGFVGLQSIVEMEQSDHERLGSFLRDYDLRLCPIAGFDYLGAEAKRANELADQVARDVERVMPMLRGTMVMTVGRAGHRFDRELGVSEKLERLSHGITPLAAACRDLGYPLAIENHGDFYCSDLVQLCRETPHLYIMLDTGNTYLIGEQPLLAFEAAAPYTIATHFKDHRVCPRLDTRPLRFEISGSPLGDGDVPLRECYELLLNHAPEPEKLVMGIEMICPPEMEPAVCLDRSLDFIRSLASCPL
jgi:sugar phosphate isomerase/epimerase